MFIYYAIVVSLNENCFGNVINNAATCHFTADFINDFAVASPPSVPAIFLAIAGMAAFNLRINRH